MESDRTPVRPGRRSQRRTRTRVLAGLGALLLVVGAFAAAGFADGGSGRAMVADGDDPRIPVTSMVAVVPPTGPPEAPPLPIPEPVPANPYEPVPVVAIGEIDIPTIGLVHTMFEGVSLTVLDRGPGHWPGTAAAGGWGNMVVAGHRTTNSRPFRNIDQLGPGDPIVVRTDAGTFDYRVTGSRVVEPNEVWIVDQQPGRTITLFACHPPGSAQYRYVVFGELVAPPTP
jgi:sortase A